MEGEHAHSTLCAARKSRTTVTVNDLPPDLLLVILRDVFGDVLRRFKRRGDVTRDNIQLVPPPPCDRRITDHWMSSAEYLASVCPLWREAMSNISIFWAQLIIWTGTDPTPLTRIRQYLAWSRDQPLHIYIMRRFDPSMQDPTEKAQIRVILDLLLPHVKRWKVLSIRLLHSSSLPLPCADLVGYAEELVQLNLDFIIGDAVVRATPDPLSTGTFDTPALEELSMGGVHFHEAYVEPLRRSLIPPKLRFLTLTDSHHALVACPSVGLVHFMDLQLDVSYTGPPLPRAYYWGADVSFTGMSGDAVAEFNRLLDYPYLESLSYTRCSMPIRGASSSSPSLGTVSESYYLTITGIADPATMLYFLTPCSEVWIHDSDGLQPAVLQALAQPTTTEHGEDVWVCPDLRGLHIVGCRQFRSADLRAVLEARLRAHAATGFAMEDDVGYVLRPVADLYVYDCGELALEDKQWFDQNVEAVRWDYWSGGTR
ncbi:uncharacterized protein B0H18DRAFT_1211793 [Fomitopsis serialis]|uniref:uncharacterized protein n=1 Tax=Fomitopsis serialis TaxID=139415 RepID=UPI00200892F0|nr:uncharacterized protein B0H18DRAFT_1211793 [Neoantrodia serialis]KAH9924536.1 hypothetical protein B0H18DRAFT_1211793 [Neoantrodia serialis]